MTKEQQDAVLRCIENKKGAIDDRGQISKATPIYTGDIDALRKLHAYIYYEPSVQQMVISNWDAELMKEPEWKQKVKVALGNKKIDTKGFMEGVLWTDQIRRILAAGGNLMVLDGKACISNWEDC